MKLRFFVEVEIDNKALVETFGPKLAEIHDSGAIHKSIGEVIGRAMGVVPNLTDVQINVVPTALRSDRFA